MKEKKYVHLSPWINFNSCDSLDVFRLLLFGLAKSEQDKQVCHFWSVCFAVAASLEP